MQLGQTRAREGARVAAEVAVLAIHPPATELRTPRVVVDVQLGPLVLAVTVARKRPRDGLVVRLPLASDGGPGVTLPAPLLAAVETAATQAVRGDPDAARYLGQQGRR